MNPQSRRLNSKHKLTVKLLKERFRYRRVEVIGDISGIEAIKCAFRLRTAPPVTKASSTAMSVGSRPLSPEKSIIKWSLCGANSQQRLTAINIGYHSSVCMHIQRILSAELSQLHLCSTGVLDNSESCEVIQAGRL